MVFPDTFITQSTQFLFQALVIAITFKLCLKKIQATKIIQN